MSIRGQATARPAPRPDAPPRPRPRPRVVPATRRRGRLRLGIAAVPLVAILFGGIVYVNSAKLAITKRQGQIASQIQATQSELAALETRRAQSDAAVRARAEAQGMVLPSSDQVVYVPARRRP